MNNLVSFLSKILILSLVSLLLITSTDVIFSKQDRQENKIIVSLKLLCELFIVFTTLLYIGSKSTEKTNNCHKNILILLCILYTLVVFNNSHIKERLKYLVSENKEKFIDSYNAEFNKTWKAIDNKEYIYNSNTKKYFNELRNQNEYNNFAKSTQQKNYSGPFKKFAAEHHLGNESLTRDPYNISNLYNNKVEGNFTTIDKVLEILERPDNNNISSGTIKIDDIKEGSILRIELENPDGLTQDTEDIVKVFAIYGNNIEYISEMEYYNIKQINNNATNKINTSKNNADNSNNASNNINNPDNL